MKIVGLLIQEKLHRFSTNTTCICRGSNEELRGKFQLMREELEYYETDYQTKMLHKY